MMYNIYLITEENGKKTENFIINTSNKKWASKAKKNARRCTNSYWECRYNECEYGYDILWSNKNENPLKEIPEGE